MIVAAVGIEGGLARADLEVLGAALGAGELLGEDVAAAVLGAGSEEAAAAAAALGPRCAFAVETDSDATPGDHVQSLAALVRDVGGRLVVLPADAWGQEVGPRLAARLDGTAVTSVVGVEVQDGRAVWTRPVFGGKAIVACAARREPVVATVRAGSFEPPRPTGRIAPVETRPPVSDRADVRLVERRDAEGGASSLQNASVVVSGGRGVGSAEAFRDLERLAQILGGTVGASLAAVDEGFAPPERQVGLTGLVVRPELYVAIGISGASQHLAGIAGAKAIVAVNLDPDAPIFEVARLGVVMDYRELLPELIAECRRHLSV